MSRKYVHNILEVRKLMHMTFMASNSFDYKVEKDKDYQKLCSLTGCFNAADFLCHTEI